MSPPSRRRRWHRLIEEYTPDGTVGRLLFGLLVGGSTLYTGVFGFAVLFGSTGLGGIGGLFLGLLFTLVGAVGVPIAVVALWPVYLSLIGNVETPRAYGSGGSTGDRTTDRLVEEHPDDNVEILKRVYAEGKISHEEFERRLDALTDVGSVSDGDSTDADTGDEQRENHERVGGR